MARSGNDERRHDRTNHYRCAALLHPLRHRILCLMLDGTEAGVAEIAVELDEAPGRVAYHLRLLVRRRALKVVPRCRPAPPRYGWSPEAGWARKMLGEIDQQGSESE